MHKGEPQAVGTGSTNITWGGLFGQSNVGHLVRDADVAAEYLGYWTRLSADPDYADIRPENTEATPTPTTQPPTGISPVFSPRTDLDLIDWYATQAGRARKSFFMTAAFGVHDKIQHALEPESDVLRYLVLEEPNMLMIQGDTRAADIYLGEFMRIFNHFYFRYLQQKLRDADQRETAYLSPDDSWTHRYYDPATPSYRQRLLFA